MPVPSLAAMLRSIGLAVLFGHAAFAQDNLVANSGFDTDLAGWDNLFGRSAVWSALDASNSPASGSALVSNELVSVGGTPTVLSQCVVVDPNTQYRLRAQAFVPAGQPEFSSADASALLFSSTDCSGEAVAIEAGLLTETEVWGQIEKTFQTAAGVRRARVSLGVFKPNGVSDLAVAHFDNVSLRSTDTPNVLVIDERLSGSWFNPATSGQGFYLDIAPSINLFFGGWFTWTDLPGQYDWLTVQGGYSGEVALVPIYRTSGGAFNQPIPTSTVAVGMAEFRFFSCSSAEVRFQFTGGAPTTIPLQRVTPVCPGCAD